MSTDKPRFSITVDDDLMKLIDDFRFENRYNSRSQAVVELLRLGIAALEKEQDNKS